MERDSYQWSIRLPTHLQHRLDALVEKVGVLGLGDGLVKVKRSSVMRLALGRGLTALEKECAKAEARRG